MIRNSPGCSIWNPFGGRNKWNSFLAFFFSFNRLFVISSVNSKFYSKTRRKKTNLMEKYYSDFSVERNCLLFFSRRIFQEKNFTERRIVLQKSGKNIVFELGPSLANNPNYVVTSIISPVFVYGHIYARPADVWARPEWALTPFFKCQKATIFHPKPFVIVTSQTCTWCPEFITCSHL